jgi:hypothetical protein
MQTIVSWKLMRMRGLPQSIERRADGLKDDARRPMLLTGGRQRSALDSEVKAVTRDAPSKPARAPLLERPPFFIVGAGRSGTTLLRSILAAHPAIAVPPETHFCKLSEAFAGVGIDAAPPDFDAYWAQYVASNRFASLGVEAERCRALCEVQGERSFAAAMTALLAAYLERTGKTRAGEKTPGHVYYADWLLGVFPEARIIAMQRDPRAIIASHFKTPWRAAMPDLTPSFVRRRTRMHAAARDARQWAKLYGEVLPRLARDPRVMCLRYEDLVADPAEAVKRVCTFVGESFAPAMLDERGGEPSFYPGAAGWKKGWAEWTVGHLAQAREPVSAVSLEKWRSELAPGEVAVIEALAAPVMARLGYTDLVAGEGRRRRAVPAAVLSDAAHRAERGLRIAARRVLRGR